MYATSVLLQETVPLSCFELIALGQIDMNGWSHIIASQNGDSTNYIFPFRLRVLQWKTIIEKFIILLIWE